jgi:hypothetical protein
MPKYIYYDGIGAKKSGKHTAKEFLNIMNKARTKKGCSAHLIDLDYKPCVEDRKLYLKKWGKKDYRGFDGYTKKQKKRFKTCLKKKMNKKTLKNRKYKCDLDNYIEYVGANFEEER